MLAEQTKGMKVIYMRIYTLAHIQTSPCDFQTSPCDLLTLVILYFILLHWRSVVDKVSVTLLTALGK